MGSVPEGLDLAFFGSTYSLYGFGAYDTLQINAFSFAMPAQCLEIDNALLQKHFKKMKSGATVIFCVAACLSFYRFSQVKNKSVYYSMLRPTEISGFSISALFKGVFPLWGRRIKSGFRIINDTKRFRDIYVPFEKYISPEQMDKNMKSMADGWITLFGLKNLKERDTSETNSANLSYNATILNGMISMCMQYQLNPVIIIPPFSSKLNQYFASEFLDNSLYSLIVKAKGDLKVPVLDYRLDKDFQSNFNLFLDGGFRLNRVGSRRFIKKVFEDLNHKGYHLTNQTLAKA